MRRRHGAGPWPSLECPEPGRARSEEWLQCRGGGRSGARSVWSVEGGGERGLITDNCAVVVFVRADQIVVPVVCLLVIALSVS